MPQITSRQDFIDYIKRTITGGITNFEPGDDILDDSIDDCLEEFYKYNSGEANHRTYLKLPLIKNQTEYDMSAHDIQAVIDLSMNNQNFSNSSLSATAMFERNMQANLLHQGAFGSDGGQLSLSSYDISRNYIDLIQMKFGKLFVAQYHQHSKTLTIYPMPGEDEEILLEVWTRMDSISLFNNNLLKKATVGLTMFRWGNYLGKYAGTLSGGGTVNWENIKNEGKEMYDKALQEMKDEAYIVDPIEFA